MASDGSAETAGRDWRRIALVACCALAAVVAALLVPTLAAGDLAGTPIDSVLPGDRFDGDGSGSAGTGGGGFGALNPGDSTGVGGDTGFDDETFGVNDTEVHFEVESTEPAYWRTGSYDTYTGSGWERDGEREPYDPPLETVGLTDGQVEFEVTLREPATGLPVVWQPHEIHDLDAELEVTEDGALRARQPVEPGTTFAAVSHAQENDVDLLRSAGDDYPGELHEQYTQLPDETPDRVGEFTDELTEDDGTAYDAAMTIQNWLREEKEYSLEASEMGDDVADHFIFEMDEGYCEYFATAMTTMLRSQDIPARYTVGYGTGQPIGDSTYEVRGMNAHAWVEVYFPEVGWVTFDPTPGDARLSMEAAVLGEEGEEFEPADPGSPGEEFTLDGIEQDDTGEEEDQDGLGISLNQTAVPGEVVEVEVTLDGEPVEGLVVTVDGEEVGMTDEDGTVVMTVPDEDELEIRVYAPPVDGIVVDVDDEELDSGEFGEFDPPEVNASASDEDEGNEQNSGETDGTDGMSSLSVGAPDADSAGDRLYGPATGAGWVTSGSSTPVGTGVTAVTRAAAVTEDAEFVSPAGDEVLPDFVVEPDEKANKTVQVERDATVSVSGDAMPGETVTITATVGDVTLSDAAVTVDGETVARTDDGGRADVVLPAEAGNVTVAVERGPVSGEEVLSLPGIEVDVETGPVALPFTTATATVTADDEAVANATVAVDGTPAATTGPDGTADVRLPLSASATVEASAYGLSDGDVVDGLALNLAATALAGLLAVALPAVALSRRGYTGRDLLRGLSVSVRRLVTYTQLALLAVARDGGSWLEATGVRLRRTAIYLFDAARGRVAHGDLRAALAAWVAAKRRAVRGALGDDADRDDERAVVEGVRRAWLEFLDEVSVADPSARTPAELAAHATDVDGFPAEPVGTVLEAFREVEYGSRPERERLAQVERALARIQAHDEPPARATAPGERVERLERVTADGGGVVTSGAAPPGEGSESTGGTE